MTEFALVAPLLFFLLLGILEASLLMYSSGTVRLAAASAARVGSELGQSASADPSIKFAVKSTALTTRIFAISWIEVRKQAYSGNVLTDMASHQHYDYNPASGDFNVACTVAGGGCTWDSSTRNITEGQSDFMKITIDWTYSWKSGALLGAPPLADIQTSYSIRLEPQTLP